MTNESLEQGRILNATIRDLTEGPGDEALDVIFLHWSFNNTMGSRLTPSALKKMRAIAAKDIKRQLAIAQKKFASL